MKTYLLLITVLSISFFAESCEVLKKFSKKEDSNTKYFKSYIEEEEHKKEIFIQEVNLEKNSEGLEVKIYEPLTNNTSIK